MLDHEVYASHVGRIHNSLLTVILLSYIIVVPRIFKICFDCKAIILWKWHEDAWRSIVMLPNFELQNQYLFNTEASAWNSLAEKRKRRAGCLQYAGTLWMASFSVVEFLGSTKPLYISSSALLSLITRTHHDVRFFIYWKIENNLKTSWQNTHSLKRPELTGV
jgi:hypothetical protein